MPNMQSKTFFKDIEKRNNKIPHCQKRGNKEHGWPPAELKLGGRERARRAGAIWYKGLLARKGTSSHCLHCSVLGSWASPCSAHCWSLLVSGDSTHSQEGGEGSWDALYLFPKLSCSADPHCPSTSPPVFGPLQGVVSGSIPWNSGFSQRAVGGQAVWQAKAGN